jgi:hypothetical protein
MLRVDLALMNLESINYIRMTDLNAGDISGKVGPASAAYELTAKGLEVLQKWHPSLALRLKAWIAVLPPWLVLTGSIAGGVTAAWKIIELAVRIVSLLNR